MKYLKTYENLNKPQVGDYVICGHPGIVRKDYPEMYDFIKNNFGQITKIEGEDNPTYYVHFDNIPKKFQKHTGMFSGLNLLDEEPFKRINITNFAKSKEELELKINTSKYNI